MNLKEQLKGAEARIYDLETKLTMVVAHATGNCGSVTRENSINDICVAISAFRNEIYKAGIEKGSKL